MDYLILEMLHLDTHPSQKNKKKIKLPIKLPVGLGEGSLWGIYTDLGSPAVEGLQRKSCPCSRTALGRTWGGRRPPGGSPQTPVPYLAALLRGGSRLPDGEWAPIGKLLPHGELQGAPTAIPTADVL